MRDLSGIERFGHLEELRLEHLPLTTIPRLDGLDRLHSIHIRNCSIASLDWLGNLPALEGIYITGTYHPGEIPDASHPVETSRAGFPVKLPALKNMYVENTGINTIPRLDGLVCLKEITIHSCPISSLDWLGDLPVLEELSIDGTNLTEIPDLTHVQSLKKISITCAPVQRITGIIFPSSLEELHLSRLEVTRFDPALIWNLYRIRHFQFIQKPPLPPADGTNRLAWALASRYGLKEVELPWYSALHELGNPEIVNKEIEHNKEILKPLLDVGYSFRKQNSYKRTGKEPLTYCELSHPTGIPSKKQPAFKQFRKKKGFFQQ
ncbi:MAG: leucine-rich repeat domain-containing protein [Promethearchaeota archaeon]